MKKTMLGLVGLAAVLMAAGCTATRYSDPVAPVSMQANLDRSDYSVLKKVQGTSETRIYCCGLVQTIDDHLVILGFKTFDEKFASVPGVVTPLDLISLLTLGIVDGGPTTAERAYYHALAQAPEADLVLPKGSVCEASGMFPFYTREKVTYTGKAIRIKADSEIAPRK